MTTGMTMALALPHPAEASLTAVLVFATAIWVGGLIAIFVVARVARAILGAAVPSKSWRVNCGWVIAADLAAWTRPARPLRGR